uniref:Cyclin Dx n=1 Tax=Salarias fasciatus TaxID=181472 RepID=A0A672FDZ0_SALFA
MDGGVCVSLWCEEVEDDQIEDRGRGEAGGPPGGPARPRAAWDPSASGPRVIQRLLQVERRYAPSSLYVRLVQRDPERREELAKWALEVCCACGCDEAVFPLAVSLLDRFLSASLSVPGSPSCLSAGCVLIASKLTECDVVTADALCAAAEYSFLPSGLREMERLILSTLRWDTAAVTPQDYLPHLLASAAEQEEGEDPEEERRLLATLRRHSDTLTAMCACDSRFLGAPPSLVAAAALTCALRGLDWRGRSLTAAVPLQVVLQCYSELIEQALRQRLRSGLQGPAEKGEEVEDERPGTPTDMREIDF